MIKKLRFTIIPSLIIGVLLFASTSYAGLNRVKTWIDVEVLTHTDLNGEINNIIDNALTLISPLLGNLDFNNKEALNLVLEKLATDGTGVEGQVIYNTTDKKIRLYTTAWGGVGGIVWKATNSTSLDLGTQGDVAFTDLDLTSVTSANATVVVLGIELSNTTSGEYAIAAFRKNGDTPTKSVRMAVEPNSASNIGIYGILIVACDSGQVIEYSIDTESSSTVSLTATVLGYWE